MAQSRLNNVHTVSAGINCLGCVIVMKMLISNIFKSDGFIEIPAYGILPQE